MKPDLIVVGTGLFGSVLGRYAQQKGLSVLWVDNQDERAASPASAGLFKPSWLSALSGAEQKIGMDVLSSMADIRNVTLRMKPLGVPVYLQQVSPERLQVSQASKTQQVRYATVQAVRPGVVTLNTHEELEARFIVVAAGVGCNDIVGTRVNVTAKVGVSYLWEKRLKFDDNRMQVWAPYKQTLVFDRGDGLMWGGDGTALKPESMTSERLAACAKRVGELAEWTHGPKTPVVHQVVGHRPFVDGYKGGLCYLVAQDVWTVTGGGKIGTVAAGTLAHQWAQEAGV